MSRVAEAALPFGDNPTPFGELTVGNPSCDFCWIVVDNCAVEVTADHVFTSTYQGKPDGVVFMCDGCMGSE